MSLPIAGATARCFPGVSAMPNTPTRGRVLVVDDHLEMATTLTDGLAERGFDAVPIDSSVEAARLLATDDFDALVTDLRMPEVDGFELLATSRRSAPHRPVIVMTAYGAIETAIEAMQRGAYHYVTKPFKLDELALLLDRGLAAERTRKEAEGLRRALQERYSFANIIGKSKPMRELFALMEQVKDAAVTTLVTGETGTGKGLVANAIHANSVRAGHPFVSVNCASLPEALLESELFGYVRGAFTGALTNHAGLFAEADGGTLLLDEIGEMTPALQAKLLHVLESGQVRAVGGTKERRVDVRIIAATHRDVRELVRAGRFREDLLYRLDVVSLEIPALRHRREDIPLLVEHFLEVYRARHTKSPTVRFSPEALARVMDHSWPGNVRELSHVVERVVLLGKSAEVQPSDLPATVSPFRPGEQPSLFGGEIIGIREVQRRYAAWALEQMSGNKTRTAERLGIDAKTLAKWLSEES
jgi:two-component system, NtrC family, response regulator HydG